MKKSWKNHFQIIWKRIIMQQVNTTLLYLPVNVYATTKPQLQSIPITTTHQPLLVATIMISHRHHGRCLIITVTTPPQSLPPTPP